MADICISSRNRGGSSVCMGEEGLKNSEKAKEMAIMTGSNL